MSLRNPFRRPQSDRPTLRQRAENLKAGLARVAPQPFAEPAPTLSATNSAGEPDPAIAVATVFRASWGALGTVLDAEVPDALSAKLDEAQGAAYQQLKTVRPTTPEGYRALAEAWAIVLKGERGDEPGMTASDHAADSLIAGAGACVPSQPVDWYDPPPGFMASPAIDPVNFAWIPQGLRIELDRLRDTAEAEFQRRMSALRETGNDTRERAAAIRASLFLPSLTAAVDPGSVEAQVLAALSRPAGPDPVFALIEEHRVAYAEWDRLSDVWNEMLSSDPGYAAAMAASDEPSTREVAAFDALFTARPSTLPGVAALTEYLCEATNRTSPDLVPSVGERGLSTVADALRAVLATREERSRRETSLVGMLDLASATMDELRDIQDIAEHVGAVAYAYAWGPRCRQGTNAYGTPGFNDAGKLVMWLGDALTDVESAVDKEVARRTAVNSSDRETRLSMLAVTTIDNGDPDEIEAFARELQAHAEAERRGR